MRTIWTTVSRRALIIDEGDIRTFLAMVVCVGTCSTFFTLPPFPCPSSCSSFRSSSLKSYLVSAFISRLARVLESVVWYDLRLDEAAFEAGADVGTLFASSKLSSPPAGVECPLVDLSAIGGGRFFAFPPAVAGAATGASRVGIGIGSGSGAALGCVTSSWRALKLRFLRIGVAMARRELERLEKEK